MMDSDEGLFITQSTFVDETVKTDQVADWTDDEDFVYRFKEPLTETELAEKIDQRIPKSTRYKIDWALSVFKRWQEERRNRSMKENVSLPGECLRSGILEMSASGLNTALKYFLFEAAKQDGSEYPSATIYGLFGAIQSHLKSNHSGFNLFEDSEFMEAKAALDAVMKERSSAGLGASSRKQTEVISEDEENMLWEKGVLGDKTSQQLVDTVLYLTGLHFSLRGGTEHRQLRLYKNPQITGPHRDTNGRSYLLYKDDTSNKKYLQKRR